MGIYPNGISDKDGAEKINSSSTDHRERAHSKKFRLNGHNKNCKIISMKLINRPQFLCQNNRNQNKVTAKT